MGCYSHVIEKHETIPGQFICDICGKSWNSGQFLNIHKRKVHKVTAHGTPVKKQKRTRKVEAVVEGPQTCHLCGKSYASKTCLQNHVRFVHEKRFQKYCHLCGMGFYSSPALERHLLSMHTENEETKRMIEGGARIWRCEVVGCSTKFMKEKGLEEHTKRVHGGNGGDGEDEDAIKTKRYTCAFCGKGFWRQSQLRHHELVHKNKEEKPYSCDICGVKMATTTYLRNHERRVHKIYKNKF